MARKGRSNEEIVHALKRVESGEKVTEVCRRLGISERTFYRWKKPFAGLGVQELRELHFLRDENRELKEGVADLTLDRQILQENVRHSLKPCARCTLATWAQTVYGLSQRRAARLIPVHKGTLRYRSRRDPQEALRRRLRELAGVRVRFGYRRLTVLRREGWSVNAKRVYRLYRAEGLNVHVPAEEAREPHARSAPGADAAHPAVEHGLREHSSRIGPSPAYGSRRRCVAFWSGGPPRRPSRSTTAAHSSVERWMPGEMTTITSARTVRCRIGRRRWRARCGSTRVSHMSRLRAGTPGMNVGPQVAS